MCEDTVMKLFNQLMVAPAALGLLAPISANASEVNISEIASYSEVDFVEEEIFDHNSFTTPLATNIPAETNFVSPATYEAGGFSDTTVATQSASFLLSAAEGEPSYSDEEGIQFNYYYGLSLDTSFDGEDNLNVGIEAGNTNASGGVNVGQILDFGTSAGDTLKVVDINYTKSFGDLTVQVGDSLDASSQFTGACAYSGFTDHLADCGTGKSAGIGGDVTVSSSYDIGGGFTAGFGITSAHGSSTEGMITKEGADAYGAQLAYATDTYGLAVSYSNFDAGTDATTLLGASDTVFYGFNGYYTIGGPIDSISLGYEVGDPGTKVDTTNWFAGVTTAEIGPGTIGFGVGTAGHTNEYNDESIIYEASYSWDVNDATSMTVGGFVKEQHGAGIEDLSGIALTTTFSF